MVESSPQAALAVWNVAHCGDQEIQVAFYFLGYFYASQHVYPCSSQFDPQRHALHHLADTRHCVAILILKIKTGLCPASALNKKRNRAVPFEIYSASSLRYR